MQVFRLIFLLITFFVYGECLGQDKQKKYLVGFMWNLGTSSYVGDLTTDVQSITFPPHIGFGLIFNRLTPNISLRTEVNYFMLSAKKYITTKNYLGFRSNNSELSATLLYEFKRQKKQFAGRSTNSFYAFTGLALTCFQTKIQKSGDVPDFRSINQTPFAGTTPSIPIGLGVKCKVSSLVDIFVEVGFRKTFSDYLDNVTPFKNNPADAVAATSTSSTVYVPVEDGDEGNKDSYFFSSLKLVYTPKYIFRKKPKSATATTTAAAKRNKKTSLKIRRSRKLETHEKAGLGTSPN